MTGQHPRKGDIYNDRTYGDYEVVEVRPNNRYALVRWLPGGIKTIEDTSQDTLVSYMPDPNDPQPGDLFAVCHSGVQYKVVSANAHRVKVQVLTTGSAGPSAKPYFTEWSRLHVARDTPMRTTVQPAGVKLSFDPKPTLVKPAEVRIRTNLTLKNWPPEKFVRVDWIGDTQFAGRVFFAEPGDDANTAIQKTITPARTSFGIRDSNWLEWTPVPKPAPVPPPEPPKPVVEEWKVTTEKRPPVAGDVYLRPGMSLPAVGATFTHAGAQPVVTTVEPLKPPRIKTEWRRPRKGDKYIYNGIILRASHDWPATEHPQQVLVVE